MEQNATAMYVGVMDGQTAVAGFPTPLNAYIGAVLFEVFLFGLFTILFIICIYVLLFGNKSIQWFLLGTSVVMYAIAASDAIYTVWLMFDVLLEGRTFAFRHLYPKYSLFVTNNLIADALLLYRCVMVWKNKLWLTGLGVVALLGVTACGYALEGVSPKSITHGWIYLSLTVALNVVLTGLAAGRILYITRQNHQLLPKELRRRYIVTVAILVESGLLYTLYLCLNLGFQRYPVANAILDCGTIQVVGIVPTMIIVQVGLGRALLCKEFTGDATLRPTHTRPGSEDICTPLVDRDIQDRYRCLRSISLTRPQSGSRT